MSDVSRLFNSTAGGDRVHTADFFPLVYNELRRLAEAKLAQEKPGQSLDATGLVHEAFLKLGEGQSFENRCHFFAAAAEAMRRILVDRARQRASLKRGGELRRICFDQLYLQADEIPAEFLALHEAIDRLASEHPRKADLVKLRFFAGLTNAQAAEMLGVSDATADNDWAYARAWLRVDLEKS